MNFKECLIPGALFKSLMIFTHLHRLKAKGLQTQFGRYLVVGGMAFVLDFALLHLLTEFAHLYYLSSAALAFLAGTALNYTLSVRWVFDHRSVDNPLHEFVIFAVIGLFGLLFNSVLIWFFTEQAGLHYLGSKLIATALVLLFNFGARKALLFSVVAEATGHKKSTLKQSNA